MWYEDEFIRQYKGEYDLGDNPLFGTGKVPLLDTSVHQHSGDNCARCNSRDTYMLPNTGNWHLVCKFCGQEFDAGYPHHVWKRIGWETRREWAEKNIAHDFQKALNRLISSG